MKTEPGPEIIEIIDDELDHDRFGRGPSTPLEPRPDPRRWATPVAAAAMAFVVAYGVVTTAISSHSTGQPPSSSAPEVSGQYYVADPLPSGFTMHSAESITSRLNGARPVGGETAELWATAGATAGSGSWFVVSLGTPHSTGANAYRIVSGGTEVVVEHDPASLQAHLSFTRDGTPMEVTAFNWTDRQLLRLVDSTYLTGSGIGYHDPFFTTDHRLMLRADPATALYGQPVSRVEYTTAVPVDLSGSFTITVGGVSRVDHDVATRFAIIDPAPLDLGRRTAIVGHDAADPTVAIVQVGDGNRLITLRGNVPLQSLVSIAGSVHPSSNGDVAKHLVQPPPSALDASSLPRTIASGMLADGRPWTIEVSSRRHDDPAAGYLWWIGQPGDTAQPSEIRPSAPAASPSIETVVEHGRTYVLAKAPRDMAGAQLHVNPNGLPSKVMPFADLDPGFSDLFTAYVFLQPVPFTAEIVDSSGATVVAWPVTA